MTNPPADEGRVLERHTTRAAGGVHPIQCAQREIGVHDGAIIQPGEPAIAEAVHRIRQSDRGPPGGTDLLELSVGDEGYPLPVR